MTQTIIETYSSLIPISLLDPNHSSVPLELRRKILRERFQNQLIADGLQTGHLQMINGRIKFTGSKLPFSSFAGFVFESYLVNIFNDDFRTIGKKAFIWCTKRQQAKNDYVDQFKAIGTGFVTTKDAHSFFYEPQSNTDILFLRKNPKNLDVWEPATIQGTLNKGSIQVKAIRGNEMTEIIEPLRRGKYSHVITLLQHENGLHSAEVCFNLINNLYKQGTIGLSERNRLEESICYPEELGIRQYNINDYYDYIQNWFAGYDKNNKDIDNAISLEIKGYRYSDGGMLVPI